MQANEVCIDAVKGISGEYIIKDKLGITLGRIYVINMSKEDKYCLFKIRFYKKGSNSDSYLKICLNKFITFLFRKIGVFKISVLVDEETSVNPFTELGFELEGIISNSMIRNNVYMDELMFGIDKDTFNSNILRKVSIKGKNIELKILTPCNAEELLSYYINNKKHLEAFEPTREDNFYTLFSQKRTLIESYKQYLNGTTVNFGIYKEEKFIGKIQLSNIVMGIFRSCFVGYSIDKKEEGKGYMKEAVNLALKYAFEEIGLHRVEASTLTDNKRSQNVLKSCGFIELGTNKNYLYINGKWRDHMSFYRLNDK